MIYPTPGTMLLDENTGNRFQVGGKVEWTTSSRSALYDNGPPVIALECTHVPPPKIPIDWSKVANGVLVYTEDEDGVGASFVLEAEIVEGFGGKGLELDTKHWQVWVAKASSQCPLPAGVEFEVVSRDGGEFRCNNPNGICWGKTLTLNGKGDIIRFKVIGLKEGYCYPG